MQRQRAGSRAGDSEAPRRHDAAARHAPAGSGHLQGPAHVAADRARPFGDALYAATGPPSPEPHRIPERDSRSAEPRDRPGQVPAVRRLDGGLRQHRRRARHFVDIGRGVRRGRAEDQSSGHRRCPRRRRWSSTGRPRIRRRTITSRGCRSGRAVACSVKHVFPSDGEYTVTITPIFGDNMTPTGFGSVPCERLEVSLDGERLELLDWKGGGRQDAAVCRGQKTAAVNSGQSASISAGKMQVKFKTTAGLHTLGRNLPRDELRASARPRQAVRAHDAPDGSDTRLHVLPARRHGPHRRAVQRGAFERARRAGKPSSSASRRARLEETACARRIITNLATTAFRRPATAADVDPLMAFYQEGRKGGISTAGIEHALARILASPKFIYRIEAEQGATVRTVGGAGGAGLSDQRPRPGVAVVVFPLEPRSRRGTAEDRERRAFEGSGGARQRRSNACCKDPRAEALTINFAGQWLNLRGLQGHSPLPGVYPDFDDPLRYAMRREVELLFDSIVREDRNIIDLLTADYTFVNERLAKHYGIPNIYGSQFRRITLGADMDVRKGLLGKAAILTTTAKPERTSPVTRGKWIMTNILGMSPPDPPPNVPPLRHHRGRVDVQREAAVDADEDDVAPRAVRLRPVPQHDGPDRVRARELRRDRAVAHRRRRQSGRSGRRRCSTARRSTVRLRCATGW